MLDTVKNSPVNGLDLAALGETIDAIEKDPSKAKVGFDVTPAGEVNAGAKRRSTAIRSPVNGSREATRSSSTSRASCSAVTERPIRRSC